jgi:hypothetical protein
VWNFIDNFREEGVGADWISFPQYFKEAGYTTLATVRCKLPRLPAQPACSPTWQPPVKSTSDTFLRHPSHSCVHTTTLNLPD